MPTDEQLAFWDAIRANPADDTARLVYADWLQENGDPDRAEFIRVQCALAKLGPDRRKGRKVRPGLEAREKELLAAYREEWAAGFFAAVDPAPSEYLPAEWFRRWFQRDPFQRGFIRVDYLTLEHARQLCESAKTVEPVEAVNVIASSYDYRYASLLALAQWIGSNSVLHLRLSGATNDSVSAIAGGGHFRFLSHLELYGAISDAGARELARWPLAMSLRVVNLQRNPITHAGAYALAESPYLDDIVRLDLTSIRINADGRQRLRERFGDRVILDPETL